MVLCIKTLAEYEYVHVRTCTCSQPEIWSCNDLQERAEIFNTYTLCTHVIRNSAFLIRTSLFHVCIHVTIQSRSLTNTFPARIRKSFCNFATTIISWSWYFAIGLPSGVGWLFVLIPTGCRGGSWYRHTRHTPLWPWLHTVTYYINQQKIVAVYGNTYTVWNRRYVCMHLAFLFYSRFVDPASPPCNAGWAKSETSLIISLSGPIQSSPHDHALLSANWREAQREKIRTRTLAHGSSQLPTWLFGNTSALPTTIGRCVRLTVAHWIRINAKIITPRPPRNNHWFVNLAAWLPGWLAGLLALSHPMWCI